MTPNNKVVYRHRRLDSNQVFYIGIGNKSRPFRNTYRNRHWHHIVNKHGYSVEVISQNLSIDDACELEEFLIQEYGRRDLKTGNLVNMTDGGEGGFNNIVSKETRLKMRKAKIGILPHNLKKVIDIKTGKIYRSIKEASKYSNLSYTALRAQLSGQNKNKSTFKLLNEYGDSK